MDLDDQENCRCEEMKVLEGKSSPRGDNDVQKKGGKSRGCSDSMEVMIGWTERQQVKEIKGQTWKCEAFFSELTESPGNRVCTEVQPQVKIFNEG
jgi:hypothetical protein